MHNLAERMHTFSLIKNVKMGLFFKSRLGVNLVKTKLCTVYQTKSYWDLLCYKLASSFTLKGKTKVFDIANDRP